MNEKSIFSRLLYVAKMLYHELHYLLCIPIIQGWYGGFWNYRHKIKSNGGSENMYYAYLMRYNAFVGLGANIQGTPMLPHGLNGIHISDAATIGEGCVILQQVTIVIQRKEVSTLVHLQLVNMFLLEPVLKSLAMFVWVTIVA